MATPGKQLQTDLQNAARVLWVICTDLLPAANCAAAVGSTLRDFGRLDVLVNNAGINDNAGLEYGSPEKFLRLPGDQSPSLLQHGPLRPARPEKIRRLHHQYRLQGCNDRARRHVWLRRSKRSNSRSYARVGHGILPYGIRVNALLPAEVMTPLYKQWLATFPDPEDKLKRITAKIPLGKRMTEPDEIAAMVLFLISAQASHITGQQVIVDGGYVHLDRALT